MNDDRETRPDTDRDGQTARMARLSDALRANLKRRRAQARARSAAEQAPPENADEPR